MKYIMMETVSSGVKKLIPIIFPDFMTHSDLAEHVQSILETQHKLQTQVRSAGSIDINVDGCFGESETLHVKSKDGDDRVINSYDHLHGIVY